MRRRILKIAGVYTAIILGAGFASGQEMLLFFVDYGWNGILGLFVSAGLFSLIGWALMEICYRNRITDYNGLLKHLAGPGLGLIIEVTGVIFLFVLFSAMLSSTGAIFSEAFGLPFYLGVLVMGIICFIVFLFDVEAMMEVNAFLAPILVVGGIFIGLYTYFNNSVTVFFQFFSSIRHHWFTSAVLYASYNIVTAVSILTSMHTITPKRKEARIGAALGGLFMGLLGLALFLPLFDRYDKVSGMEIPFLKIIEDFHPALEYFYVFIFLAAVLTTALGNGFGLIQWIFSRSPSLSSSKVKRAGVKLMITLLGGSAAFVGFSQFVGGIYPLFGYTGLFQIILILICFVSEKEGSAR